jgi:hypothetical protein
MIQEEIDNKLAEAITNRWNPTFIGNLKFLKAELQRGKSKVINDNDATNILVGLIKSQIMTIKNIQESTMDAQKILECQTLILDAQDFLSLDVVEQLYMRKCDIMEWIDMNVDFTKLKNKMQAIKVIKSAFPYIDGELVKETLEEL